MKYLLSFLTLLFISLYLPAQVKNVSDLAISDIMKGDDFVGYLPSRISWSDNSKRIYFSWNPNNDTLRSTYKVDIETKEIHKLSFEEEKAMTEDGDFTADYSKKVFEKNGDIFLMDNSTFKVSQITNTLDRESDPEFSGNEKLAIYRSGDNLYSWSLADGSIEQLTNFKKGKEKKDRESDKASQWLEEDQLARFQILKKRKDEDEARSYRRDQIQPDRPKEIYLEGKGLWGLKASPDQQYVIYQLVKSGKDRPTNVPDYVTESGYTEEKRARSKVGTSTSSFESWIYNREADSVYQIKTDNLEGIYTKPGFLKQYADDTDGYNDKYDKPKETIIGPPLFSESGNAVVNVTSQDNKDRWVASLDLATGTLKMLDHQHDEAWIGGPGIGWFSRGSMGWLDEGTLWFKSEATGYAHLYSAQVKSGKTKQLTKGDFEILDVQLSKDKKTFYITSNKESPHEHHFYHMPAKGGKMTRITTKKGGHEVTVSPDEKYLAIRYSYSNKPWELYLMPNEAGAKMQQLTESTTDDFDSYEWRVPEIVHFEARDGAKVPASLYKPGKPNGAAVIFVHGAGYLQNVHYWWPSYYREYMFHNILADNGYTVLAVDFRASAGYGRDWRTAIYRHMGGKDLDDQVDGAQYLIDEYDIDADRIGLYGGSYGGFITLMAMFKYPDVFKSGAALRSVTDWAHYNHGYTANILNTPTEDSLAYAQSSPIYFAEGLKGHLLMLHGMIDTNVHFQDVVRLSQRLIELGKENWDLAVFPLESHGFVEPSSWADEYRRIYKLFEDTLKNTD